MTQLTLFAKVTTRPEHAEALGQSLSGMLEETRAEPGCISFAFHRDNDDPCVWLLYENWASREDLDLHFEKPYTRALMETFPDVLAKDLELNFATLMSRPPT